MLIGFVKLMAVSRPRPIWVNRAAVLCVEEISSHEGGPATEITIGPEHTFWVREHADQVVALLTGEDE